MFGIKRGRALALGLPNFNLDRLLLEGLGHAPTPSFADLNQQDPPYFGDDLRIGLAQVARGNDAFRSCAFEIERSYT